MKAILVCFLYCFITGCIKQPNQKPSQTPDHHAAKTNIIPENEMNVDTEILPAKDTTSLSSQPASLILSLVPRDIPTGETINPDSLSIKTEYNYYPLSTTEVKITATNHSRYEYECGEDYSLAYYDQNKHQWEALPTDPRVNSVLWVFPPQHPVHQQTIKLSTSESPNRPGKYRIYKSFNRKTKVAYGEFEMVDKKGVKRLRKRIDDYCRNNKNAITAKNISMSYTQDEDTIFVMLTNNALRFQEMFKREVLSYSAVSHGKIQKPKAFTHSAFPDTLQIRMKQKKTFIPEVQKVSR